MSNSQIIELMSHIDMSNTQNIAALAACMQCDQVKELSKKRAEIGRVEGNLQQNVVNAGYLMGWLMAAMGAIDLGLGITSAVKIGKNVKGMSQLHNEMESMKHSFINKKNSLEGDIAKSDSYRSDDGFALEHLRSRPKEHLKRDLEVVSKFPEESFGGEIAGLENKVQIQNDIKAELRERDTQIASHEKNYNEHKSAKERLHSEKSGQVQFWTNGVGVFNQGLKMPVDALRNQKDAFKSVYSNSYQMAQSAMQAVDGSVSSVAQADTLSALRIVSQSA